VVKGEKLLGNCAHGQPMATIYWIAFQVERTALVKDRTRLLNRLKAQNLSLTKRQSKAQLALIERQLAAITRKLIELANALIRDDRKWSQRLA